MSYIKNLLNKISILNDFYYETAATRRGLRIMSAIWDKHALAEMLSNMESDTIREHFLKNEKYQNSVNDMVAEVQRVFRKKFHDFVANWNAKYPENAIPVCHECKAVDDGGMIQLVVVDQQGNHFCQNCVKCAHGVGMNINCGECLAESTLGFSGSEDEAGLAELDCV